MKVLPLILILGVLLRPLSSAGQNKELSKSLDFFGTTILLKIDSDFIKPTVPSVSPGSLHGFYDALSKSDYKPLVDSLLEYKIRSSGDDWLYYQLIRKVAQLISPKAENYTRYTLYKWFLLAASGYDVILTHTSEKLLFYVRSNDSIYNIPTRVQDGKQYVCLNHHDVRPIDFEKEQSVLLLNSQGPNDKLFSYKISQLPDFQKESYISKDIHFNYNETEYNFKVKVNPQVQTIFANYPTVDYASFLNIPLSKESYNSLIPLLRKNIKGLNKKNGVDYLMRFTRYAFMYEADSENFGEEKRLSPEQTLIYSHSDCEDRVALFFYLVKEIYDLPMIVLTYPNHVTIAIKFDKPVGNYIIYNGIKYSICEPTPQRSDLQVGQSLPSLKKVPYEVAYVYVPKQK